MPRRPENPSQFFETFLDTEVDFYGVCDTCFRMGRGGNAWTFEAVEDPSDGYRSLLECVRLGGNDHNLTFFVSPLERVRLERSTSEAHESFEGYRLVGVDSRHVWLRIGTSNTDDYYPSFVFEYTPPARVHVPRSSPLSRPLTQAPPKPSNQHRNVWPWEEL